MESLQKKTRDLCPKKRKRRDCYNVYGIYDNICIIIIIIIMGTSDRNMRTEDDVRITGCTT